MGDSPSNSTSTSPCPLPARSLMYMRRSSSIPSLTAAWAALAWAAATFFLSTSHHLRNPLRKRAHLPRCPSSSTSCSALGCDALYSCQHRAPIFVSSSASWASSLSSSPWSSASLRAFSRGCTMGPGSPKARKDLGSPSFTSLAAAAWRTRASNASLLNLSHLRMRSLGASANIRTIGAPPLRAVPSFAWISTIVSRNPFPQRSVSLILTMSMPCSTRPDSSAGNISPSGPREKLPTRSNWGTMVDSSRPIPIGLDPSNRRAKSPLPHCNRTYNLLSSSKATFEASARAAASPANNLVFSRR
mmetsp:Transcript_34220/g.77313  ORF Transcript_34220/g.77313 Transcript_34220/m.77313 type:complete len:302 (-) Transcript_34220:123-1028(-)